MKLLSFEASKVYEYLDFNFNFNNDITFLTGSNGSGKTTILLLLRSVLTLSFRNLFIIPFETIIIRFENNIKDEIKISKNNEKIIFKIDSIVNELKLDIINIDELIFRLNEPSSRNFFQEIYLKYSKHEVIKFIESLNTPIFLGLDRRIEDTNTELSNVERVRIIRERNLLMNQKFRKGLFSDNTSLTISLIETEILVQQTYKKIRRIKEFQENKLLEEILLSSFNYISEESVLDPNQGYIDWEKKKDLIIRRNELEQAISNISITGKKYSSEVKIFFDKLENLFKKLENRKNAKDNILNIEWIINIAQIDRISKIVKMIDENKSKVTEYMAPINNFIGVINRFYKESNKYIEIDPVGHLTVKKPNKKISSIESLSSGERQLLIIFSHLIFNSIESNRIFIIDEPELSLHLNWQDKFVEEILQLNPNIQLIMATHSPEIIASYKEKAINIKKVKKVEE